MAKHGHRLVQFFCDDCVTVSVIFLICRKNIFVCASKHTVCGETISSPPFSCSEGFVLKAGYPEATFNHWNSF